MASPRRSGGRGMRRGFAVLVAVCLSGSAVPATLDRWNGHVAEASARFGVPEDWIRRVIQAESGGRTMAGGRPIVSRAGAMGLMQLMPGTFEEMRRQHRLGTDPHDPRDNILAGTAYLRAMHDRFGYPGLFAAYNAGPKRYIRHVRTGTPLPPETISYMAKLSPAAASPLLRGGKASAAGDEAGPMQLGPRQPAPFAVRHDALAFIQASSTAPGAELFLIGGGTADEVEMP